MATGFQSACTRPKYFSSASQRRHATLAAGLHCPTRAARPAAPPLGTSLQRLGQRLDEGQVAVEGAAAERLAFLELADVGDQLVDQDHAGRIARQQRRQHLLAGRGAGRVGLRDQREAFLAAQLPGQFAPQRAHASARRACHGWPGDGLCRRAPRRGRAAHPSARPGRAGPGCPPGRRRGTCRVAR